MPKKIRVLWWYLRATTGRYYRRLFPFFLIVLGVAMIFPFVKKTVSPLYHEFLSPIQKPVITEGLVGSVKTLNPILATTDAEKDINQLVFRGLTQTSLSGEPVGDLALDYKVENNKEYTFRLRDDVFWHDGQKLTADDVIHTVKIAADSNYQSPFYETLKDVSVTKLSDFEVKMTLKEEFAPFLSLTHFGIIPSHIPLSNYKPVGTGSFRVIESKDTHVLLRGETFNILFKYYATRDLAYSALKQGEIQALGGLTAQEKSEVSQWPNLKTYSQNVGRRYVGLFINSRVEKLKDKALRQALQMATPKKQIVELTTNNQAQEASASMPLHSWVEAYQNPRYQFNLEEAKKQLDRAGWKIGGSGKLEKDGQILTLTITTLDNRSYLEAAEILRLVWGEVGINVEKITVSSNQLRDTILPHSQYEILLNSQEVPADPDQYNLWHSTQVGNSNFVGLNSPKVDKALEDGRLSLNRDDRIARYSDFQRFLSDDTPVIFLYFPDYHYVVSSRVAGIDLSSFSLPKDRFQSVGNWTVVKKFF
jgi:peptide/nickel transport system substrate-binding protein